ncbi:MAG: amino acid--tRNA ligase-related protein, partial [Planctomycetota bacterium]
MPPEGASIETLRARAALVARTREFFAAREVLEVETPLIGHGLVVEAHLEPIPCAVRGAGADSLPRHLLTSPEGPMKRLLARGSGPIYQLAPAFRDGERGARHTPEFTILEWYRPGFDHHALMAEVEALVRALMPERTPEAFERRTYRDLFRDAAGIDPFDTSVAAIAAACARLGVPLPPDFAASTLDDALDLLLVGALEPTLGRERPLFLVDYPAPPRGGERRARRLGAPPPPHRRVPRRRPGGGAPPLRGGRAGVRPPRDGRDRARHHRRGPRLPAGVSRGRESLHFGPSPVFIAGRSDARPSGETPTRRAGNSMALSPARPRAAHRALLRAALGLLLLACLPSPASAQRPAEDPAARQVREAVARGDLKGAIDLGRSLLPANLDNPRLREQLGGAYYLASVRLQRGGAAGETVAGLQREARTHLARAAELSPGPLPIRLIWTLALLENSLGDAAGALRAAGRGLRDHPGELRLLTVRAQARTALGELDEAEREWRALVAAQPGSLDAVIGLGGCLEALGRACDAADLFIDRGFAGDEGEAARSWRAQFELVRVLVACGRLDDTIGPLERALALEPQRARIAVELAEQYHRAGRSDDALPLLDRWLGERGFADRELRTTAHYRRARILANRGEMARARE